MDIAERRVPQDGRIKMKISKNRAIDFRVSTCPTLFGEKVVMRILDSSSAMLGIDSLGYEPFQKELYLEALARPHGMILVTGPPAAARRCRCTRASTSSTPRTPTSRRPKTPSKSTWPASTRCTSIQGGAHVRRRPAGLPAPGSGHHHGRPKSATSRRPRSPSRRRRRPPGALDAAHQ